MSPDVEMSEVSESRGNFWTVPQSGIVFPSEESKISLFSESLTISLSQSSVLLESVESSLLLIFLSARQKKLYLIKNH